MGGFAISNPTHFISLPEKCCHLYLNSAIPDTKLYKTILNVMLKIVMSTSVPLSNTGFQFMLKIISVLTLQKTKHSCFADNN